MQVFISINWLKLSMLCIIVSNAQVSLVALQKLKARKILAIKYKLTFPHLESLKQNKETLGIKRNA